MKVFIGTGRKGWSLGEFTTVDIDPNNKPNVVADAASMPMFDSGSADEVYASHVLEHFAWPRALQPLQEWARILKVSGVLKIAVPDMALFGELLARGQNPWVVMSNVYGAHWLTPGGPQGHHYGWTYDMLTEVLTILGFEDFRHWTSDLPEAANGWVFTGNGEHVGMSLNIAATKKSAPLVDIAELQKRIHPTKSLAETLETFGPLGTIVPKSATYSQKLHFRLVEEHNRNKTLKEEIRVLKEELARRG